MYSKEIDEKWQKKWAETNLYKFDENSPKKKLYCHEMHFVNKIFLTFDP